MKPAENLGSAEIRALLCGEADDWLFARADAVKRQYFGKEIWLRGIVEFSSYCRCDCHYCGLRAANRDIERYRLSHQEIIDSALKVDKAGIGTLVLQSGEDSRFRQDGISRILSTIKQQTQLAITLSLGERSHSELALWREAGADRYLLKLETLDAELYSRLRPGRVLDKRLRLLETLKSLGYETGSGIICGLPGSKSDALADALLALSAMELEMLAVGPFVSHPQTPFANTANGNVLECQRACAILRLLNPGANIPATSALDALQKAPGSNP